MARANSRSTKSPVIAVPNPADDKVRVGRIGLIAAVGLAAGLIWPRLIGVHLVPPPPTDSPAGSAAPSAASTVSATPAAELPSSQLDAPPASSSKESAPAITPPKVTLAQVVSCRSNDGARETHCDSPTIDSVVQTPLQSLVACDAADGAHGVLSVGFDVDFESNRFEHFTVGKSTTVPAGTARQLLHCAEKELSRVSLEGAAHTKSSYRVFYKVDFDQNVETAGEAPAGSAPAPSATPAQSSGEVVNASGRVTVTWEAALVRAKPKDGEILARVLGGTRLTVTGRQGEWYRVKYDAKGSEGWVYKAAIGL